MLVVSLWVFWAKRHYIQPKRSILGLHAKKYKRLYIFNSFYLLDSCNQSFFRGPKKGWAPPRLVSFTGSIQNFRRTSPLLSYGGSPKDDSQRRFLTHHSVATLLRHCFEWLQRCSNIAAMCCAKNRGWESSRVNNITLSLLLFGRSRFHRRSRC